MGLVLGFLVSILTILCAQEIGEFCWKENVTVDPCLLRLQVTQHGTYYAFNGKETCIDHGIEEIDFVYGSGHIIGNELQVGLTSVSVEPTIYN